MKGKHDETHHGLPGSVLSFPKRDDRFGDARYRGNADGRVLLGLISQYNATRIVDPMEGSGTSRDVFDSLWPHPDDRVDANYWGSDLRDGFDLTEDAIPMRDVELCYLHPPYWNMIRYSDNPRDLSTCNDYREFTSRLGTCISRCAESLATNGRLAVLVGDVRRRGEYTSIVKDVLGCEGSDGLQLRSVLIKLQHNCRSDSKRYGKLEDARILHEYCVVFQRK